MTFYAQNGEDKWLADNWQRLGLPDRGIFVEVGVGDGVRISNTKWLEDRGWVGMLIEPDSRHHASIIANRRARLVPKAVGTHNRPFVVDDDPELSGFLRTGTGVSVEVAGLTEILDHYEVFRVDVLSIDTEGTELEVWSTLDLLQFRPRIVFVEWKTSGLCDDNSAAIRARMEADGYEMVETLGCNLVFMDRGDE